MPNALLVYPEFPPSYWSGKYALEFIGKKASMPPLGLLTLAALFPDRYELRVVDMNVRPLDDADLEWADYVFCSAMIVQRESFREVMDRCCAQGTPTIAGGPYPTSFHEEISGVDYFVLGEVEGVFGEFLEALESGKAAHITMPPAEVSRPPVVRTPPPRYDLVDLGDYASVALQFSRGCPYDCEFCDITQLYGRVPRTKPPAQMLAELDVLYELGWRRTVFFVDDNFIGNRHQTRKLLPEIARWQRERNFPFSFYTEASVNLAEMPDLLDEMADAGFDMVFLGLETPNPNALLKANKGHNVKEGSAEHLLDAVRTIQRHGLEVSAGFILGLDGDDESSFDAQIQFVQAAGIPTAMVGLLTALKGTHLYERYRREGRLLDESGGNNVSASLNFVPAIGRESLLEGYKRVLATLYDPSLRNYFDRCFVLLKNWQRRSHCARSLRKEEFRAFILSMWRQLFSRQGLAYARFLTRILLHRPTFFAQAIRFSILGYHYEKVTRQQIVVDEFKAFLELERKKLGDMMAYYRNVGTEHRLEAQAYVAARLQMIQKRMESINTDFRYALTEALESFQEFLEEQARQATGILDVKALLRS